MRLLFLGFGTVGQGLAELLLEKKEALEKDYGFTFTVTAIGDALKGNVMDPNGIDLRAALDRVKNGQSLNGLSGQPFEGDGLAVVKAAQADVLLEATYTDIKTGEPATSHIRTALERGMHVVTTNKGPVALHAPELLALAKSKGVKFLYEGTVMSGTPLLNLIRETLAGTEIQEMQGILNGTTNYILSEMEKGLSYETALKTAQELGYAEAVPDADVLGWDALAKVTILGNVVFGGDLKPGDSPCEGITGITLEDVEKAKAEGKRYKLIGRVWRENGVVKGSVGPQLVSMSHPLSSVMGATNAMTIKVDALGEVTIVGPGAGRVETGYSMLVDLLHIGRTR